MTELEKRNLLHSMSNMAHAITGSSVIVTDCPQSEGVAYCSKNEKNAHIAVCLDYPFDDLSEKEKKCIFYGLFAHEVMHLLLTEFKYSSESIKSFPSIEKRDRHDIFNICEDPAIEWFSGSFISSFLTGCLEKTIEYFHRHGPELQECDQDAYMQYIASMVMFGDMGVLKGSFTYDDAREAFIKTAPIMLELIEEPDGKRRFDLSQQVFEIVKPLWKEHQDNLYANADMQNLLKQLGVTGSSGNSDSQYQPSSNGTQTQSSENRRKICKLLESLKEDLDDSENNTSCSDNSSGATNAVDSILKKHSEDSLSEPFEIPEDIIEKAEKAYETAARQIKKEMDQESDNSQWEKKPFIHSPYYGDVTFNVSSVEKRDPAAYQMIVAQFRPDITNFKALLKKVFLGGYVKKEYKTSGKLNVGRFCGRKITARVFDRRCIPDNKQDMSITILVDQSGSMNRHMQDVKNTLIVLLESLSAFSIPVKVIGFTTAGSDDADYFHYGKWKNDLSMRESIPFMKATGSTFLGHAIRYGGSQLKKRTERHRLFIVITDGDPYHRRYRNPQDGCKDCIDSVKEIEKYADVIGIGFFDSRDDKETFKKIFKEKAILMDDMKSLVHELPKQIGKIIRK